ncbi:MAG: ROK family protein [Desulfitobacteriaceae bacterium]
MVTKGTARLRERNEKKALAFFRVHKTTTRQDIAAALRVSKNTASLIVERFIRDGIVKEISSIQEGVGRPRMQLVLVRDAFQSIGMLIQDSQCEYVVTDYTGEVLEAQVIPLPTWDFEFCMKHLIKQCQVLLGRYRQILGIGVAVPGLVDPVLGTVHYSAQLGWRDVHVSEILNASLPVPVRVLNRVNAAALSPIRVIPDGASSTFYIRVDKGVGGALIIHNEVFHGTSWTAGEVGHLSVQRDGPLCTCGQRGCLESLISVPAIQKMLKEKFACSEFNEVREYGLESLLDDEVLSNPVMEEIMAEAGKHLGVAIAMIINLCNPESIVVDSPYNSQTFKSSTLKSANERALAFPFEHTHIIFVSTTYSSSLGMARAIILGYENE